MSKSDTKAAVIYALPFAPIGSVVVGTKAQIKGLTEAGSVDPHADAIAAVLDAGGTTIDLGEPPAQAEGQGNPDPAG